MGNREAWTYGDQFNWKWNVVSGEFHCSRQEQNKPAFRLRQHMAGELVIRYCVFVPADGKPISAALLSGSYSGSLCQNQEVILRNVTASSGKAVWISDNVFMFNDVKINTGQ